MTTIRVKLRASTVSGKAGSVYYQVIHQRQHVQLTSSVKLHPHEWDSFSGRVRINDRNASSLLEAQRVIDADLAPAGNPFKKVYTGIDVTRKRAVDKEVIIRLKGLDLTKEPVLDYARDLFLFCLYARGMAFVDMAYLQKEDVKYGVMAYIRRKTGTRLCIKIEPCLQEIIDRYKDKTADTLYVLPIITSNDKKQAYREYQNGLSYYNKQLKQLSEMLGYHVSLSSYTPRHTWATTARDSNIPLSVISTGMGHSSEKTTQIYLATMDNSIIDKANCKIISAFD